MRTPFALAALLLATAAPAGAQLAPRDLAGVGARPQARLALPVGLLFTDARGSRVTLAQVADGRPLALLFADFTCRHICAPGLAMTAGALAGSGAADYRLAVIGLDPRDPPAAARDLAAGVRSLPQVAARTRFLTADAATIARATGALGYRYVYDPGSDQFAHDASLYVFAADGRLAAVLPELTIGPAAMKAALAGAAPPAASFGEKVAHLCYGFAAAQGRYARAAVVAMQAGTAALVAALIAAGLIVRRRRRTA